MPIKYLFFSVVLAIAIRLSGQNIPFVYDTVAIQKEVDRVVKKFGYMDCIRQNNLDTTLVIPWADVGCMPSFNSELTQGLFKNEISLVQIKRRQLLFWSKNVPWIKILLLNNNNQILASSDGEEIICRAKARPYYKDHFIDYILREGFYDLFHLGCIDIKYYFARNREGILGILNSLPKDGIYEFIPIRELPE